MILEMEKSERGKTRHSQVISFQNVCEYTDPDSSIGRDARGILDSLGELIQKTDGISLDKHLEMQGVFQKAFSLMSKKQWKLAELGFLKMLKTVPNHVPSLGNLGLCYGHLGQFSKAISSFDRALAIDPDYEPAILNREQFLKFQEGDQVPEADMISVAYAKEKFIREHPEEFSDK